MVCHLIAESCFLSMHKLIGEDHYIVPLCYCLLWAHLFYCMVVSGIYLNYNDVCLLLVVDVPLLLVWPWGTSWIKECGETLYMFWLGIDALKLFVSYEVVSKSPSKCHAWICPIYSSEWPPLWSTPTFPSLSWIIWCHNIIIVVQSKGN